MRYFHFCVRKSLVLTAVGLWVCLFPCHSFSITMDEAIQLAKDNLPSYRASKIQVRSTEALYDGSLAPYLPTLDASAIHEHHVAPLTFGNYDLSSYDVTLSYILFDWGRRKAGRDIARQNLEIDKEELEKNLLELRFNVKSAFYTAVARRDILEERKVQLTDAHKDYEVAQGRNRLGAAKLSDVLQTSVRLEQARFNLVQAEGEVAKALSDLNSLLGRPLDLAYDLEGSLDFKPFMPDPGRLSEAALQRPEIKQGKSNVIISKDNRAIETSSFFPVLTANASYNKTYSSRLVGSSDEDSSIGIRATWNIFELGKFYRRKSSEFQIGVLEERLNETIRQLLLELRKAYEDYLTVARSVKVAEEQLNQAQHNYSQAFGEYKVGKGDILSLVQAESLLSVAREQLTVSRLNLVLSKSLLERATGIERLESLND